MNTVKRGNKTYKITIGLEVHAQVASKKKLFSNAPVSSLEDANTAVSFVDCGMPGMLPVLNFDCIELAVKTGLAINAEINKKSQFDRKHYFYPDLPQGYQITQLYEPIVKNGYIEIETSDELTKKIRIKQIHLEQDAGKLVHDKKEGCSYIDYNRSGIPLMEIVSEPDLSSIEEVMLYIKSLRAILREVGSSDADMEKGNFRCDVNISLNELDDTEWGTRCEIKNLNSFKSIAKAIEYEANRQADILYDGGSVRQQTRLYDQDKNETRTLRDKDDADDYRYFPDPDLLPVNLTDEFISSIRQKMPKLPSEILNHYVNVYNIQKKEASVIVFDHEIREFFEKVIEITKDPKLSCSWLTTELLGRLNKLQIDFNNSPVTPINLAQLIQRIQDSTISGKIAKDVLDIMIQESKSPDQIIKEKGLVQVTDISEIEKFAKEVLEKNQDKVLEYKSGKERMFGFFVGEAMKLAKGKANPQSLTDVLKKLLQSK